MSLRTISAPLATLLLLAGGALAQEKQVGEPSGKPKLSIEKSTHHFGEVKSGTPLKYSFKIKNQGNADLVINNVAPS